MYGKIPTAAETARLNVLERVAVMRAAACVAAALVAALLSLVSPIAALFALAVLAMLALMRTSETRFDPFTLAGPALAALIVGAAFGAADAMGVLFIWRLQADARWSVREARRLSTIAGRPSETTPRALAHMWLTPLYGLMLVAYTSPHMIAGLPLDLPHVPVWIPVTAACVAFMGFADWALRAAADWRLGELATAPAAHVLTHHLLFLIAFGLTGDVSSGIVAMIAWRLAHAVAFAPAQASLTAVP